MLFSELKVGQRFLVKTDSGKVVLWKKGFDGAAPTSEGQVSSIKLREHTEVCLLEVAVCLNKHYRDSHILTQALRGSISMAAYFSKSRYDADVIASIPRHHPDFVKAVKIYREVTKHDDWQIVTLSSPEYKILDLGEAEVLISAADLTEDVRTL